MYRVLGIGRLCYNVLKVGQKGKVRSRRGNSQLSRLGRFGAAATAYIMSSELSEIQTYVEMPTLLGEKGKQSGEQHCQPIVTVFEYRIPTFLVNNFMTLVSGSSTSIVYAATLDGHRHI